MEHLIHKSNFSIGNLSYVNEFEARGLIYEIFHQNIYLGNHLHLKPGSVILDVGANIGVFSLFALSQCENDAEVYSFEPIPITFECLKQNLQNYGDKVHVYNVGISDVKEESFADFTLFGNSFSTATYKPQDKLISNFNPLLQYTTLLAIARRFNKPLYYKLKYLPFLRSHLIKKNYDRLTHQTQIRCKLISLGDFIEKNNLSNIDYLKIDVEGAEVDVLNSIKPSQFSKIHQICIEVHDINNRVDEVSVFLQNQGFTIHVSRNPIFAKLGFNHHLIYAIRT